MYNILLILTTTTQSIIPNGSTDGFKEVATLSPIFGMLVSIIFVLAGIIVYLFKLYNNKITEINTNHTQYTSSIEKIQTEYSKNLQDIHNIYDEKIEKIKEKLEHGESERNRLWADSEKQTFTLLSNLSNLLEISEKLERADTQLFIEKLNQLENNIKSHINTYKK